MVHGHMFKWQNDWVYWPFSDKGNVECKLNLLYAVGNCHTRICTYDNFQSHMTYSTTVLTVSEIF